MFIYKNIKMHQAIIHRIIRDYTKQCKVLSSKKYMTKLHYVQYKIFHRTYINIVYINKEVVIKP